MQQRIRLAMQDGSLSKMGGEGSVIEADETFIGGLARNMHKGRRKYPGTGHAGKEVVMGLLERGGKGKSKVRTKHVSGTSKKHLQKEVRANVHGGSELHTDQLVSYKGLDGEYIHKVVDHAVAYVQDNVHTNGLENFWAYSSDVSRELTCLSNRFIYLGIWIPKRSGLTMGRARTASDLLKPFAV